MSHDRDHSRNPLKILKMKQKSEYLSVKFSRGGFQARFRFPHSNVKCYTGSGAATRRKHGKPKAVSLAVGVRSASRILRHLPGVIYQRTGGAIAPPIRRLVCLPLQKRYTQGRPVRLDSISIVRSGKLLSAIRDWHILARGRWRYPLLTGQFPLPCRWRAIAVQKTGKTRIPSRNLPGLGVRLHREP